MRCKLAFLMGIDWEKILGPIWYTAARNNLISLGCLKSILKKNGTNSFIWSWGLIEQRDSSIAFNLDTANVYIACRSVPCESFWNACTSEWPISRCPWIWTSFTINWTIRIRRWCWLWKSGRSTDWVAFLWKGGVYVIAWRGYIRMNMKNQQASTW